MTEKLTVMCDFCGTMKKETNHWFRLSTSGGTLRIVSIDQAASPGMDACGHQCVCQGVARFMDHGDLTERKPLDIK